MSTPSATTGTPYWCFISYRHADNREQDRAWASWLHQEIERYEVPAELVGQSNRWGDVIPERIYPVFRDEESLAADSDLAQAIVNALNRSRYMVVLCSRRAVESTYVADEIRHFKRQGGADRIIAAIVDGVPGSERECFPEPLRHPVGSDGELDRSHRVEPLAADFRLHDGSEGFTSAEGYRLALRKNSQLTSRQVEQQAEEFGDRLQMMKLKVIAGILGVPMEQLRDRDKAYQLQLAQRRARTLRRWLAAVAMLSVLAIAGGVYARVQQNEAVAAQRRTVKEMIDASWKASTFFVANPAPSFADTKSYISGSRALYRHLRLFMDLTKLQSLSPVPVFLSGAHLAPAAGQSVPVLKPDFDFESYDFGRYNPQFVSWAFDNAIPASTDATLRQVTQPFYDGFLREMSRYYYLTYLDVQAALPRMNDEVIPRFLQELEKFRDTPFVAGSFLAGPGGYLQLNVFNKYARQFTRFDRATGKDASVFKWSSGSQDAFYPSVAGCFWIRRMVDGTSAGVADVLRKLLTTYDREWLSTAPEAQPHSTPGSRRFPIEF